MEENNGFCLRTLFSICQSSFLAEDKNTGKVKDYYSSFAGGVHREGGYGNSAPLELQNLWLNLCLPLDP